ncbi:THO complex subunit 1 transcription elongation factor (macronuclear) [Tetrahymena thermophila SB210]|uniref:THO complex subunit 1 transcription elongation factor n=1 Tax=Tetrahymena thermophila (strain SB210) TaxID=312017 RepID=I7M137_TETTS|nr:THO complex subunit 1 transcription elongation factor [Tetrahymena thermophila SB210]EAR94175.2 THO complex subunit 1 transcription elongation factor [Tetrahymena thermophila SB210]|eukprot:XP_001014420.2 THO complex subunit 1 transcription elongation factor [Tetrahymena thermophila SB210]
MDDIKEVFGRINVAMIRFSHTLESKLKTLLHQLNEGLKKLKQNKEDEQKQMYQDKLLLLFRKTLSDLMKNWGAQESEETSNSIKELVKLIFWCAKKEIVLVKDALSFSEDFCDMLSVNDLREFIDTFESSIHTINYLSEQDSNYPLKICNVIFKKLTRTYDTRLRGELHIFLSKILPICHASGLKSKICTEITAQLENESDIAKNQNIQGNQMEIEEDKSQPDNITYSNKDFYKKFWTLQKYFQNPFCLSTNDELLDIDKNSAASCSTSMEEEEVEEGEEKIIESKKVKAVCSAIQLVLDRFNQNPIFEKREANIKPYIKYLTTYSLLEKQLSDPFFRKIWLLQALLFFYAIQNKTKDLEIKNIDSEMALIKTTEEKVKKTFIQLHENLKEEINFEKLDLFFIDEKIWVERKDMLPRQNKDEKFNFKNPCEKTREMIEYYHKSILVDKKDNSQKSEFTFDSHKMLQQKQFAEMEAFKKKIIQDCSKTGGNSITEESNVRQILGKEIYFPIKTNPIQKSVGYYINQVIDQLKDSTSEKLVDDPIFVTKAMRASFRYNLNWVEKDKESLKDLENFAKEFEEKEVDKQTKQDKEKERDKSTNKESQQQPEQVQAEDLKKSKIDKTEKSSRSNNENDENPQADQSRNTNSSGSNFSSRQDEKSKSQPQKISNQSESKQNQDQPKNNNSSNNQSSSNAEKVNQPSNSNNISKNSNDNEQRGKHNEDKQKKDDKNERQNYNNENSKSDLKIDESKNSRQDNEKERRISQENNRQQGDEKANIKVSDEQINNERPRQNRQESNFSDSKNEDVKSSSNKEDKSKSDDKNERSNQNQSQKQVSDDKYKNKVDSKQKDEKQQIDEENRRFQSSEDNRKTSKDESKRFYNQEDNRKNNDESRKNNEDGRKNIEDQGFDKNDNQKQFQGNNNSNQNSINISSSKNNNQQQSNASSSSSSSKNVDSQKNEPKQGDESNKSQNQVSNNSNNQGSGNFSNMNNNNNSKPQLNLKKNDPPNVSQVNSGNSSGGRTQGRSRSKEKQSNTYSSSSGSSRNNTNNSNNNQYSSGGNNNPNGNNSNYNSNSNYQQGGNSQYSNSNSYNSSKYNQRDDSKQNSGYGSQNNNYNQGNYNKGNNSNNNNYSNKRDYNNNSQYDNNNNSNNNKRDNYDRKNFQNSNYYNNRGNEYEPGPNKRQKN